MLWISGGTRHGPRTGPAGQGICWSAALSDPRRRPSLRRDLRVIDQTALRPGELTGRSNSRADDGWKYAMSTESTDTDLDADVLSRFRARLTKPGKKRVVVSRRLDRCRG